MTEFKCILDNEKDCNDCNKCIKCYDCFYLIDRFDETAEVLCDIKGTVDVHSTCNNFKDYRTE